MKTGRKSPRRGARRKGIANGPRLEDGAFPSGLLKSVASVKGVGPKTAEALARRGVRVIEDLLYFIPVRYEDRRFVRPIEAVAEGDQAVVSGRVVDSGKAYSRASRRRLCYARIDDGTGCMTL